MARDPEIAFLQRLALTAASAATLDELLRLVISETTEALATDVCSVYLRDAADDHVVLTATNGLSHAGVGRVRLGPGEGVTGWTAQDRRPVVVPDVRAEPRFRWLEGVDQARFVSMCSVPITAGDRLVGVLNVQTEEHRAFSDGDVRFLSAIAAQVAGLLARVELQERLERRVAELGRSEEVHRRLRALVAEGAGLGSICDEIALLADVPLAVYDAHGEPLAAAGSGMPDRLPDGAADPRAVAVTPLRAGGELLGWMAAAATADGDAAGRRQALEHGATVLALEVVRRRAEAEAEDRARDDLLGELLSPRVGPGDAERLAGRAARLGQDLTEPVWVVTIEGDDARTARALSAKGTRTRAARDLAARGAARGAGVIVGERAGGIVLLASGVDDAAAAEALAADARDVVAAVVPDGSVSCGVSGTAGPTGALHRLSEEARQALAVTRRLGRRGVVASYGRLGIERLLLATGSPEPLESFVEDCIGALMRHDEGRRARAAPLLDTLDALVAEGWNMRAAARRLGVHVNTLLYRAGRVEALTGRGLDEPDVRLALALALRARVVAAVVPSAAAGAAVAGEAPRAGSRSGRGP